eukprot:945332-Pyramimonas_sp.AAC.1
MVVKPLFSPPHAALSRKTRLFPVQSFMDARNTGNSPLLFRLRGCRGGVEGIYRSSLDARKPQNPINRGV